MRATPLGITLALALASCAPQQAATPITAPALVAPAAPRANTPVPTGDHWLIGRWTGQVQGTRDSGQRVLVVTGVAPDGSVTGRWGGAAVPMALSGDTLRLTSAGAVAYELRRTGPNELTGSTMQGSVVRSLTLTKG